MDAVSGLSSRRIAFVGQGTYFEACSLGPGDHGFETRYLEYRAGGEADRLVAELRAFAPAVVVVFRPEIIPAGMLAEVDAITLGFLTEPIPRTEAGDVVHEDLRRRFWELEQVDATNFDRVVSFDPHIARTAGAVLDVWRSLPLPVADRFYRPVGAGPARRQPLFVGHATAHREQLLVDAKHNHDIMHVAFGAGASELERLMGEHDIAINVHNNPYPSFENRVCLHLAAGHLVLSEPLSPLHGLEPGIDYVQFETAGQLDDALWSLRRRPNLWRNVRLRGRRKAEQYRASRVYPRLLGDLTADLAAFGS
jgi:hypothetical protein